MTRAGVLHFTQRTDSITDSENGLLAALPLKLTDKKNETQEDLRASPLILSKKKPFLLFDAKQAGPEIALELTSRYFSHPPDVLVSFVSGTDLFHTWKRDDFRSALQAGIVKLLSALDLMIIDDGLNYGLTRLLASAIRSEEEYRSHTSGQSAKKPFINYLGIVPLQKVANSDKFRSERGASDDSSIEVVPRRPGAALDDGFDLNPHHSHYILLDKSPEDVNFLRVDVEKQLQGQLALQQAQMVADSTEDPSTTSMSFVPHVIILFQGGLEELDRVQAYLELHTPVLILNGCGGIADVIVGAMKSSSEPDEKRLRGALSSRLVRAFPTLQRNERLRQEYTNKLMHVIRQAAPPSKLCQIIDCTRLDTFESLDKPLLQAVIISSAARHANWDQMVRNFMLCLKCNRSDICAAFLVNSPPWCDIPSKIPYPGMVSALIYPGREAFVDMLLQQRFPVRFLTSYMDLVALFRKAVGKELFLGLVWDDILGHNQSDPIREEFVLIELNPLIYKLTGVRNYLDFYELSRVALTRDDTLVSPAVSDANGLNALIVFAVLLNRAKLVKVLLKYAMDPIPTIVFVETMYRGMYRHTVNTELRTGLKRQADEFGTMATEILDAGIRESPQRAKTFFQRTIPAYNGKTTLEMAFDARNRTFISNPLVQNWLDSFGNGFIRVKGGCEELKMVLSAYLLFPMYIWLSFPKLVQEKSAAVAESGFTYEPQSKQQALGLLESIKSQKNLSGIAKYTERYPPFFSMVHAVWSAPIVKYWTWFIIYILFLIVIGTDMMMPACTNWGLDIAVVILTLLIWLELVLRTVMDILYRRRMDVLLRATDIIFQTVFNVLFIIYRVATYNRYEHPFAGRVILAFGVMYYYYSVWQMFFVFSRQLGPLVRICMIMFKQDLPKWLIMMLPFFISVTVVWQAIITPDYPFTGEDWRRAIYRSTFTFFGAFYTELEYSESCEANTKINWNNFSQPLAADPLDRCWLGDYSDHKCNTVSFWAYVFVGNYYFFLKLGMTIILVVFYIFRQTVEMPKANLIWRYYRFETLFDYYWRSNLPFPLNIIGNIHLIVMYFVTGRKEMQVKLDPELVDLKQDTFIYWKSVAADYFAKKDREESSRAIPIQQAASLGAIKGGLQSIIARFGELGKKLSEVDESARDNRQRLRQTTDAVIRQISSGASHDLESVAAPHPHTRSRDSPYIGTAIRRLHVDDDKVDWETVLEHYHPEPYSRALEDFSVEEQEFVDHERDNRRALEFRMSASAASMQSTDWNAIEYNDEDAIYRKTWIVDENGDPLMYRLDANGLPMNPNGRTGLRGRGSHCRYGPNHRIILAITTTANKKSRFIIQLSPGNSGTLPNVPLCHYDSEYSVAAILLDSIFNEGDTSEDSDFDPSTIKTESELSEIVPMLYGKQWRKDPANAENTQPKSAPIRQLYRGYLDTPLNTDNAWMEALVLHVAVPSVRLEATSVYRWKTYSPAESGLLDFDAVIMRSLNL
ncbi:putative Protein ced-11 [Hypsibius exemplaris]|uniref:Uncharacterized protein n=1 Tax=Hypsibius exemplaris TaxID=2072580 RepID=A0A1W0X0G9_HYPEX|nr:putative Protein ced-11 [Hypsibius exemplaris]